MSTEPDTEVVPSDPSQSLRRHEDIDMKQNVTPIIAHPEVGTARRTAVDPLSDHSRPRPASLDAQDCVLGDALPAVPPIVGLRKVFSNEVRREWVGAINELQADSAKVGRQHSPEVATWGEALVRSGWTVSANRVLRKAYRSVKPVIASMSATEVQQRSYVSQLQQWPSARIIGPDGGSTSIAKAEIDHDRALRLIQDERANGSRRHEKVSRVTKTFARISPAFDLTIIALFLANILNVNLSHLDRTPLQAATAGFLAVVATIGYAIGMHWFGESLRHWKNNDRWFTRPESSAAARMVLALFVAIVALPLTVGALMIYRILNDAHQAQASLTGSLVTAIFMALMVSVLGWMVGFSAFFDGSAEMDAVARLAKVIKPARERRAALIMSIAAAADRLEKLRDDVDTAVLEAVVDASDRSSGGDQVIMAARSYLQSTGPIAVTLADTSSRADVAAFLEPLVTAELRDLRAAQDRAHTIAARGRAAAQGSDESVLLPESS